MKQVIVRVSGGIGNQLFSYAAARRLAETNGAELIIDDVSGFVRDHTYKRGYQLDYFNISCRKATALQRLEPFSRVRRMLKRKWNERLPFMRRKYIKQQDVAFDPRLLHVKPRGTVYLEGLWQSENYFKDVEAIIRQDLQITPPADAANLAMAEQIRGCNAVAVHVRFFDDPQAPLSNNVPGNYYARAVEKMQTLVPDAHYFVFSDQPEAALVRIPLPNRHVTLVSHNRGDALAYADLWLMTNCRHFILANSTFSWWGAWLASWPSKCIIAPGIEMRHGNTWWGFEGLLPKEWIKL